MTFQKIISLAALTATFALLGPLESRAETTDATTGEPEPAFVYFIAPEFGTIYPEPVTVTAEIGVIQGDFEYVTEVELLLDGVSVGIAPCEFGCTFEGIELGLGEHTLVAHSIDSAAEDTLLLTVGEQPSGETGESGGAEESDGGSSGESGGEDADDFSDDTDGTGDTGGDQMSDRGCSVDGSPSPWGLMALPILLLLPALRRRD